MKLRIKQKVRGYNETLEVEVNGIDEVEELRKLLGAEYDTITIIPPEVLEEKEPAREM